MGPLQKQVISLACFSGLLVSISSIVLLNNDSDNNKSVNYAFETPRAFAKENFELYIRVKYDLGWGETTSLLLPSLQLFWPSVHAVIVFDAEEKEDRQAAANISRLTERFAPVRFRSALRDQYTKAGLVGLHSKLDPNIVWHGYQREHVDMMYADENVQSKFIGIVDSDALMVTLITPELIFSPDGRPRIIGALSRSNFGRDVNWKFGIMAVQFMIQKDHVISCMSYFPVILKREHIRMFRKHVEHVHKKPFLQVYKEMFEMTKWYCHFSMMCNYVWHFHHADYEFHYHSFVGWAKGWDSPQPGQIRNFSFLTEESKRPFVRASTHASYSLGFGHLYKRYMPQVPAKAFLEGFCHVAFAQCFEEMECSRLKAACLINGVDVGALHSLLFRFERWQTWEWDGRALEVQRAHYKTLIRYMPWAPFAMQILEKTQPAMWTKFMKTYRKLSSSSRKP